MDSRNHNQDDKWLEIRADEDWPFCLLPLFALTVGALSQCAVSRSEVRDFVPVLGLAFSPLVLVHGLRDKREST